MKNILLVAVLLSLFSCTYKDRQVHLKFDSNVQTAEFGKSVGVNVVVFDDRVEPKLIGSKKFGQQKVNITADEELTTFLHDKISRSLLLKGFKLGVDKVLEVRIQTFAFKAERGFPVGNSKAKGAIKVIVRNMSNRKAFAKDYVLGLRNDHFISSFQYADERNINQLLEELINDILEDNELMRNLAQL